LHARQDIVDQAGIRVPETWDELEQASIKIKNAGIMDYPLGYSWNYTTNGYEPLLAQLYGRDGSFCTADGGYQPMSGQKGAEDTIRWCVDIYNRSKVVPPDCLAWKGFTNNESFMEGTIAFTSNGNSIWWAMEQQNHPLLEKTHVGQMPGGPARRVNVSLSLYFAIFRNSKQPELAKDLIKYLLSEGPYTRLMESGSAQNVPVYQKYMDMEYYQKNPTYKHVLETAEAMVAMGWPGPMTPAAAEVVASQTLMDMLQRIITRQATFDEGVKEADDKIKTIYDILQK
jgi:multiple sugar transport system substrate-binding protein